MPSFNIAVVVIANVVVVVVWELALNDFTLDGFPEFS